MVDGVSLTEGSVLLSCIWWGFPEHLSEVASLYSLSNGSVVHLSFVQWDTCCDFVTSRRLSEFSQRELHDIPPCKAMQHSSPELEKDNPGFLPGCSIEHRLSSLLMDSSGTILGYVTG